MDILTRFVAGLFGRDGGLKTVAAGLLILFVSGNDLMTAVAGHGYLSAAAVHWILTLSAGLGVLGVAHKLEKAQAVTKDLIATFQDGEQTFVDAKDLLEEFGISPIPAAPVPGTMGTLVSPHSNPGVTT